MPNIKQITLPSGNTYDIVDQGARDLIAALQQYTDYLGVTTTPLTEGATTNPIVIDGESVTAKKGNIANYGSKEFIYNGSVWQEFGDLSGLGSLAYKNSASGSYTPSGTVSKPTFTGDPSAVTITATNNSSGNYTPNGSVSKPTFTGDALTSTGSYTPAGNVTISGNQNKTATVSAASSGANTYTPGGVCSGTAVTLNTTSIKGMTSQGTLPTWDSATVFPVFTVNATTEVLTISNSNFNAGTLPGIGTAQTVATGVNQITDPTFSGNGVRLVTANIAVPNALQFGGTEATISVSGTPTGNVAKPTFTGTTVQINGTVTPTGNVSAPIFNGNAATITVS